VNLQADPHLNVAGVAIQVGIALPPEDVALIAPKPKVTNAVQLEDMTRIMLLSCTHS
jgi:hypothetical protein